MAGADQDFYRVLGVPRNASQDDIQRAYRKLARESHPDVNKDPGAEERFKDISEAYNVLADPQTRRRYDAFGPDFRQVPEGVDPETWRRARAGGGAGPRAGGGAGPRAGGGSRAGAGAGTAGGAGGARGGFGADVDLDDLLGGLFGGRGGAGSRTGRGFGAVPGADQEAAVELTVEDAYHGTRSGLTLTSATGTRSIDVTIPAGVTDGQRIRLAGQGGRGGDGAPPGDLYLIVRIAPHRGYRLEGRDLHVELRLSPWEAALGTSVAVATPGGEVKVSVPAGTSSGRRLRLRGRGLPNPRGQPGDLFAEARIMVPATPSDAERELFERLAAASDFDPRRRR